MIFDSFPKTYQNISITVVYQRHFIAANLFGEKGTLRGMCALQLSTHTALPVTHLKWISMRLESPLSVSVWLSHTSRVSARLMSSVV